MARVLPTVATGVVAAACVAPGAAHAATARLVTGAASPLGDAAMPFGHDGVDVRADAGEANHLTLTMPDASTVVVRDPTGPLTAGGGCAATAPGEVTCAAAPALVDMVTVSAGDGDDVVDGSALPVPLSASGGPGDDLLIGGRGDDVLMGGPGRDQLVGGAGNDHLIGGGSADRLDGGDGADVLDLSGDSPTALREFATCGDGADEVWAPDGQEAVSTDCDRVAIASRDGQRPFLMALPLHRVARGGAWTRVWCSGTAGIDRCDVRVTLKRRSGAPPLHGRVQLPPGAASARLVLRGAHLQPHEALWVVVRGTHRTASGTSPLAGGFKVVVP